MSSNNEKCLIIGCGQVGRAIFESMKKEYELHEHDINEVKRRDRKTRNYKFIEVKTSPEGMENCYMHICFPYSDTFEKDVTEYYNTYKPKLIVINSSVKIGTTLSLAKNNIPVVHSPVVFDDNNFNSLPYFRKLIGYDSDSLALLAEQHLRKCFNTALVKFSANTELSDLMMNLYAMSCRAITFEMGVIFKNLGLDYRTIAEMMHFNNLGYSALNKGNNFLQNITPSLNKADFRTKLIDLLPEKLQSLFFKLAMKSYKLEEEVKKDAKSK